MARQQQDEKKDMAFADSWKQNAVELGALGALVLGAGHYAVHGNLNALSGGVKDSAKNVLKAFDRYVVSRGPVSRFVRNIGVGGSKKLLKYPGVQNNNFQLLQEERMKARGSLDPKAIEDKAQRAYKDDFLTGFLAHQENKNPGEFKMENDLNYYREKIKEDELDRAMKEYEKQLFGDPSKKQENKPQSRGGQFFGAGLSGLGFGMGLTAFHGLDRAVRQKDDPEKRDRHYEIAGSFLKGERQNMDKKANFTRALYDALASVGARTPQAIATGLGYTGVTLGTAALLKNHPELLQKPGTAPVAAPNDEPSSPRIIIELGKDKNKPLDPHQYDGYGMSPRVAEEEARGLAKLAGMAPDFLGDFVKNVLGRHNELGTLNDRINEVSHDYRDAAAEALKGQDIGAMIQNRYPGLAGFDNQRDFAKEILDSQARAMKREDAQQAQSISDNVKRDRLLAGAGLAGLAGTGIGLASLQHKKEESHV